MKKQSGFTIVEVLLVVLILSVVGFGGYYVWHSPNKADKTYDNSSKSSQATSPSSKKTTTNTPSNSSTSTTQTQQYLTIAQWQVKIPLSVALSGMSYSVVDSHIAGATAINISSSALTNLSCTRSDGSASTTSPNIGEIYQTQNPNTAYAGTTFANYMGADLARKVGSYYYYLSLSEGLGDCQLATANANTFDSMGSALRTAFQAIIAN